MKVICTGMPKCGTKTLSAALRILGYNVYDFEEQFYYGGQDIINVMDKGWTTEDIRRIYKDADAVADIPGCTIWEEIYKAFPDVKFLHTERKNEDEWAVSLKKQMESIGDQKMVRILMQCSPTARRLRRFFNSGVRLQVSSAASNPWSFNTLNMEFAKLRYREHNSHVKAVVPKDQFLHFNFADGWEPLCKFLGVTIPSKPFPHKNKGGEATAEIIAHSYIFNQIRKEIAVTFSIIGLILAVLFYIFVL